MAAHAIYEPHSICSDSWWAGSPTAFPIGLRGRLARGYVRALMAAFGLLPKSDFLDPDYDWARFRRFIAASERILDAYPTIVRRSPATVGEVPGEWFEDSRRGSEAAGIDEPVVLYVHGGSYVLPRSGMHDTLAANIARESGLRVFAVDYRIAPEHPWPAGLEDVVRVHRALLASGRPAERIAIVGDSAGGGLALASLLRLRALDVPRPAAFVAFSPWADLTFSGASIIENARADPFMSDVEYVALFAQLYLQGADASDPLASPALADLSDLPDTLVHVGSTDLLLDDARQIVDGIRAGGGNARLDVWDEMPHVWQRLYHLIPEAACSIAGAGQFLRRRLRA